MENTKNSSLAKLFPVMLCFFAMGFVDLVGIASNYVKADLNLTDSQANIFPSLVFFWFLIFSVPTGMLMNRIGRKKTVLLSLVITFASLLLPVFGDGYVLMLLSFSLLGIGNALMQTSLNPLLSNIVSGERLASSLTFGQFVKAIASFLAPYIAMWGATQAIPSLGMGWRVLFPVYMVIAVIAILWLSGTSIREEKEEGRPSTFGECLALLGKPFIFLCFLGIMCHVGIDVGTNTTAPKILMERLGMTLADAGFATSLYFIFRTAGCFLGAFILQKMAPRTFFGISVLCMLAAMVGLFVFHEKAMIYICIAFSCENALLYTRLLVRASYTSATDTTCAEIGISKMNSMGFFLYLLRACYIFFVRYISPQSFLCTLAYRRNTLVCNIFPSS